MNTLISSCTAIAVSSQVSGELSGPAGELQFQVHFSLHRSHTHTCWDGPSPQIWLPPSFAFVPQEPAQWQHQCAAQVCRQLPTGMEGRCFQGEYSGSCVILLFCLQLLPIWVLSCITCFSLLCLQDAVLARAIVCWGCLTDPPSDVQTHLLVVML